ncbi:hypothetical protein MTR67_002374 [Solanum verrucosum]|uniref:Uncharacterized protein n=1 Tax=Solanum verrucosum TaxID=315347 RepID=A0AAF0PW25_SOLVR|nr:hypothetical protein MTR67_002374 [Solanum verrucosum]
MTLFFWWMKMKKHL